MGMGPRGAWVRIDNDDPIRDRKMQGAYLGRDGWCLQADYRLVPRKGKRLESLTGTKKMQISMLKDSMGRLFSSDTRDLFLASMQEVYRRDFHENMRARTCEVRFARNPFLRSSYTTSDLYISKFDGDVWVIYTDRWTWWKKTSIGVRATHNQR